MQIGCYTISRNDKKAVDCVDDIRGLECIMKHQQNISQNKSVEKQLMILKKLKWNRFLNVVTIYDYYHNEDDLYVFMEKCDKSLSAYFSEDLQNYPLNFQFYQDLISQICNGYLELKKHKIIHRDIKPDNILVIKKENKITYKICDFDISDLEDDKVSQNRLQTYNQQGTRAFAAPEIAESKYSYEADMFSLGLTIFYLLADSNHFNKSLKAVAKFIYQLQTKSFQEILKEERDQQIKLKIQDQEKDQILEILNQMLVYEPKSRISWENLHSQLSNLKIDNFQFQRCSKSLQNPNNLKQNWFAKQKLVSIQQTVQQQKYQNFSPYDSNQSNQFEKHFLQFDNHSTPQIQFDNLAFKKKIYYPQFKENNNFVKNQGNSILAESNSSTQQFQLSQSIDLGLLENNFDNLFPKTDRQKENICYNNQQFKKQLIIQKENQSFKSNSQFRNEKLFNLNNQNKEQKIAQTLPVSKCNQSIKNITQ